MTLLTSFIINSPLAIVPGDLSWTLDSVSLGVGLATEDAPQPLPSNSGGIIPTSFGKTGTRGIPSGFVSAPLVSIEEKVPLIKGVSSEAKVVVEQNVIRLASINISAGHKPSIASEIKDG